LDPGAPGRRAPNRAIGVSAIARTRMFGGKYMQTTTEKLLPAQKEVHRTAHDQDLVEVPKRARLDREAEGRNLRQVIAVLDNQ
jgi:hypothetical protein